jgi:hypothetical protein
MKATMKGVNLKLKDGSGVAIKAQAKFAVATVPGELGCGHDFSSPISPEI